MDQIKKTNRRKKQGFILLLGILVATVLFSIGVSFSSIVYKELILAFTARESQISFYAADVGVECVKYWDNVTKDPRFGPGVGTFLHMAPFHDTPGGDSDRDEDIGKIECGGSVIVLDEARQNFTIDNNDYCDTVRVTKGLVQGTRATNLRSWGFNTSPCDPDYPRRTDRALEARYKTF